MFLHLDRAGRILSIWDKYSTYFSEFGGFLRKQGTVFEVFDFLGAHDMDEAAGKGVVHFVLRPEVSSNYFVFEPFSSSIPLSSIRVFRTRDNRYCGMIVAARFMPNIYYANDNIVLYTDPDDRICGYNETIQRLFRDKLKHPDALLGAPASDILTPSPGEIQAQYLEKARKAVWTPSGQPLLLGPEEMGQNGEWRNQGTILSNMRLPWTLDTRVFDFRFTLEMEDYDNGFPVMTFGVEEPVIEGPAGTGYQVNELALLSEFTRFQIKRKGFSAGVSREPLSLAGKGAVLTLEKRGRALFFRLDGREVLSLYDPCFLHHAEAAFYLGLRPGCSARVRAVRLEAARAPAGGGGSMDDLVVRADVAPPRYFSLTPFYNVQLSSAYISVFGYILHDVTGFNDRVKSFQERYRTEKAEGERLRRRLLQYEGPEKEFFVGESPAVRMLKERADTLAASDAPILITGETGTGKEVLARFLHDRSGRREMPFVKVDCSALPASLIESELFGHERGAFTGAVERKTGRFEQAQGGTLFLDEIANLSREVQAKLLNILQDLTVTRIGGAEALKLDVRVVAATNIPLETLMQQGRFREDLYYRINTLTVELPALRDRMDDIPLLVRRFVAQFNASQEKRVKDLTPAAYRKLYGHAWPGNIRELRNVVQRAVIFCEGEWADEGLINLPEPRDAAAAPVSGARRTRRLADLTGDRLRELLGRFNGSVTRLSRELKVSRRACYDHLEKHGLAASSFRKKG